MQPDTGQVFELGDRPTRWNGILGGGDAILAGYGTSIIIGNSITPTQPEAELDVNTAHIHSTSTDNHALEVECAKCGLSTTPMCALVKQLEDLKQELETLKSMFTEWYYSPGAPGYQEAERDFNKQQCLYIAFPTTVNYELNSLS